MCDVGNIPERATGITGLVDELVVQLMEGGGVLQRAQLVIDAFAPQR